MPWAFFSIRAVDPQSDTEILNGFVTSHRVVSIEKQFVDCGLQSFWSVCVEYVSSGTPTTSNSSRDFRKKGVDYREVLTEAQFTTFSQLRDYRKRAATSAAVPVYALFTNEQLAAMVQANAKTLTDLHQIPGVGESKVKTHGESLLAILNADHP
jgi:superfamily II DNA helicase RecQ